MARRPIRLWDVEDPTLPRQSAHRWRWGCQPYAQAAFYPFRKISGIHLLERPSLGRCSSLVDSGHGVCLFVVCRVWLDHRVIMQLEGLGNLEKNNVLIGNRTRYLPVCRTIPQPTMKLSNMKFNRNLWSFFKDETWNQTDWRALFLYSA
jgi:hypothetical protein